MSSVKLPFQNPVSPFRKGCRVAVVAHLVGAWVLAGTLDQTVSFRMGEERNLTIQLTARFDEAAEMDLETSVPTVAVLVTPDQARMADQIMLDMPSSDVALNELLPSETLHRMIDPTGASEPVWSRAEPDHAVSTIDATDMVRRDDEEVARAESRQPEHELQRVTKAPSQAVASSSIASVPTATAGLKSALVAPDFSSNPPPRYPRRVARLGVRGVVLLLLTVDRTGRVEKVQVIESSGHQILDAAAVSTVRNWQGKPATRDGRPIASTWKVPIRFRP